MTTIFEAKWWIASRVHALNVLGLITALAAQYVPMVADHLPNPPLVLAVVAGGNILVTVLTQIKAVAQ